jgi:hypothetical protein
MAGGVIVAGGEDVYRQTLVSDLVSRPLGRQSSTEGCSKSLNGVKLAAVPGFGISSTERKQRLGHHGMMRYGAVEVSLHTFLILAVYGNECSFTLRPQ